MHAKCNIVVSQRFSLKFQVQFWEGGHVVFNKIGILQAAYDWPMCEDVKVKKNPQWKSQEIRDIPAKGRCRQYAEPTQESGHGGYNQQDHRALGCSNWGAHILQT
jgi:hypothetical protein